VCLRREVAPYSYDGALVAWIAQQHVSLAVDLAQPFLNTPDPPGAPLDSNEIMAPQLPIPKEEIAEFCRRNGIRRFGFFGSVLTGRFSDSSDIDVLIEFHPGQRGGIFPEDGRNERPGVPASEGDLRVLHTSRTAHPAGFGGGKLMYAQLRPGGGWRSRFMN
jgi:hypothetical protein